MGALIVGGTFIILCFTLAAIVEYYEGKEWH